MCNLSEKGMMILLNRKINVKDPEEFRKIFVKHGRLVYHILLLVTGNLEDAEDVLQDTFVALFNSNNVFSSYKLIRSWLIVVAKNLAANLNAKKYREKAFIEEGKYNNETLYFADDYTAFDIDLLLDYDEKVITVFRLIDGLSFDCVAKTIGKSSATVKRIYKRAIKKLKDSVFPSSK